MPPEFRKSFTLLELLVVIAIIGLVVTIIVVALSQAQARARDAKRQAELNSIQKAVELYHSDYEQYPDHPSWVSIEDNSELQNELKPYLPTAPTDPLWPQTTPEGEHYSYQYMSTSSGAGYKLHAELEAGTSTEVFGGTGDSVTYVGAVERTRWASFDFSTGGSNPKWLSIRHLDGSADDSFNLFINGENIWHYTDKTSTETWYTDHVAIDIIGESTLEVKLEATGVKWDHFEQYGQVGISFCWLRLDDGTNPGQVDSGDTVLDQVDIGTPSSESGHNLQGWGPIEPDTSGGNWGGIGNDPDDDDCRTIWSLDE